MYLGVFKKYFLGFKTLQKRTYVKLKKKLSVTAQIKKFATLLMHYFPIYQILFRKMKQPQVMMEYSKSKQKMFESM